MAKADLHIHCNYSDGSDSIFDLIEKIKIANLDIFALTDHDTIAGAEEIKKIIPKNIKYIPSIELTCLANNRETDTIKCHILGYNCNTKSEKLLSLIEKGKILRKKKLEKRIKYLKETWNIILTEEELKWLYSRNSVVKTHLANILVNRGLACENVSAMKKYLDGCKTPNSRFDAKEAIDTILSAGGIPVWAHPLGGEGEEHITKNLLKKQLELMKSIGIKGLECYYSRYDTKETEFLKLTALENNLLISGGSDYHGTNKENITLAQLNTEASYVDSSNLTILNYL